MNKTDINYKNAKKVLEWCKKEYGKSIYHRDFPKLNFQNYPPTELKYKKGELIMIHNNGDRGEYFDRGNQMFIYGKNHTSFLDFVRTVIHEYTHYLQDDKMYQRYTRKHKKSYNSHPYELRAEQIAKRDGRKCLSNTFKTK
jgi:hypothetical protein